MKDGGVQDTEPVRIAVVGVGHLGRHHARVASHLPGARCVGVHDHHAGRADEVARAFGLRVLPGAEAVADEADAVILATPTVTHARLAVFYLERGLDVLVEKPMAATVEEADAILAAGRAGRRVVAVGHVERHNPAIEAARAAVLHPTFVEVHRLGVFTRRSLDVDVVLDLMIHDLQIARVLAGSPPVEVRAAGTPVLTRLIDIANARIAFESGMVANLTASRVSSEKVRKLRLFAPSVSVTVDMQAQTVTARRVEGEGDRAQICPVAIPVDVAEPLVREQADFLRAVRGRGNALVPGEEGREALALAHRVLAAISVFRRAVEG
ncbi:MAG: Gfo/Idh/MocA family protein, partial [Thermoanaerobaculia bacterium]